MWKPATRATGITDDRRNGMHVLRHTYASVLLDAGESVKALSVCLGHSDPGFTLRIYRHLLPTSEDRTRRAIDAALAHDPAPADVPEPAEVQESPDGPDTVEGLIMVSDPVLTLPPQVSGYPGLTWR